MPGSTPISIEAIHEIRDSCLCLAAQRAARVLARRFDRLFAPLGVTNGQFSLMVALSGAWAPKLSELAGFLAMDQTTLTAAVKTLEKRGLLVLHADARDGRIRRPALTPAGRGLVAQAIPLWKAEHAAVQAALPDQQAQELAQILSQLG